MNKIAISNSGTISIGNISQQENNWVCSSMDGANLALQRMSDAGLCSESDLAQVKRHVRELGEEAQKPQPDARKGMGILEAVQKNFSWAYPIIKDLITKVWPALNAAF